MATWTFSQLLNSDPLRVYCCFTSTETVRTIRDVEPGLATSTFSHFLGSVILSRVCDRLQRTALEVTTVHSVTLSDRDCGVLGLGV